MNFFQEFRIEAKILLVVAVVAAILVVGGILIIANLPNPTLVDDTPLQTNRQLRYESKDECAARTQSICVYSNDGWYSETQVKVLETLKKNEREKVSEFLEQNINNYVQAEPVLGAPQFFIYDEVEFYEGNKFIAPFEDGHIGGYLLGTYSIENGEIEIIYLDETLREEELDGLKKKHGFIEDIETSDWEIYRNDEYGFELKYPESWITELSGPNYVQEQIERGETISGTVAPTLETISFFAPAWQAHPKLQLTTTISKTSKEISVENYEKSLAYSSSCDPRFLTERPTHIKIITNENGVAFLEIKVTETERTQRLFSCYYAKNQGGTEVALVTTSFENRLDFEYLDKTFQTILSTFRFVDSVDTSGWQSYRNDEYGFEVVLPETWQGYSVITESWDGRMLDGTSKKLRGPKVVIRNPNWSGPLSWQDVPILVFTKDEWELIEATLLTVSAAPIGPGKLGENEQYVFALPPRWAGFTDALGQDEAQEIAKTFKALAPMEDWQSYRNREYGFEFLRPDMGSIQVSTVRWEASFDESVAKIPWERDSKEVMVAGVPAVQGVKYYGGESGAWHLVTFIDLTPKTVISLSTWTTPEDDEKHKENLQQHEKILSTFRFIDPNDLSFLKDSFSGWGTYEGRLDLEIPRDYTRRDFKFGYPLNWVVNEAGLRRGLYISTFADAYIPISTGSTSVLPAISSKQGTGVISVQPWDRNPAYSLDRWADFKGEVNISGESVEMVILERGTVSETESENLFIRYEVPAVGLEGRAVYVASEQERWTDGPRVVYEFRLLYNQADSTENKNIYEAVFNQILSSFQVIE